VESRQARVERWIRTLGGRAYALASTLTESEDDARDLLQEAWMFVIDHDGELPEDDGAPAFVFTVVRKLGLARIARSRRRSVLLERFAGDVPGPEPDREPDVDRDAVVRPLLEAINELPTLQREVIVARIIEGRSIADTARKLDRAPGTVKASLSRGVASLRSALGDDTQEAVARINRARRPRTRAGPEAGDPQGPGVKDDPEDTKEKTT
jgi:RNA polymerase sigma-70 factor (ECF subfamily)